MFTTGERFVSCAVIGPRSELLTPPSLSIGDECSCPATKGIVNSVKATRMKFSLIGDRLGTTF